jgi:hypothetical protein
VSNIQVTSMFLTFCVSHVLAGQWWDTRLDFFFETRGTQGFFRRNSCSITVYLSRSTVGTATGQCEIVFFFQKTAGQGDLLDITPSFSTACVSHTESGTVAGQRA